MADTENDKFMAGEIAHRITEYRRQRIPVLPKLVRGHNGLLRVLTLVRKMVPDYVITWRRNETHYIVKADPR